MGSRTISLPSSISSESGSVSDPLNRPRSVNDFETDRALQRALKDKTYRRRSQFSGSSCWGSIAELGEGDETSGEESDDCDGDFFADSESDNLDLSNDWVIPNLDPSTSETQSLAAELDRLKVLRSYQILDSEREEAFERLTALAARMFDVPIALVSLVDMGRQWFMSNRGLGDTRETPRKLAFCAHAILCTSDLLIVPDATKDPRFMNNILVTGPPYIRFYGGVPLVSVEGVKLGTFCIIDTKIHPDGMSLTEKHNLRELAALVMGSMEDRRQKKLQTAQHMSKLIACTAHDLLTPLSGVQLNLSLLRDDPLFLDMLRPCHRELIENASSCCEMVTKVCDDLVSSFKSDVETAAAEKQTAESSLKTKIMDVKRHQINIPEFVQNIRMVIETYPKTVPLYINIDPEVPTTIVSDDLKIFRSVINYLTNACNVTKKGCIQLRIFLKRNFPVKRKRSLIFECQDTGPGVLEEKYPHLFRPILEDDSNLDDVSCVPVDSEGNIIKRSSICFKNAPSAGLGLYSVAASISSIGGRYGFFPKSISIGATENKSQPSTSTGSVFWFSVPLVLPAPFETQDRGRQKLVNTLRPAEASLSQPIVQRSIAREKEKKTSLEFLPESINAGAVDQNIEQRPRTALVIDDSLIIRKSLSRALGNLEFIVRDAKDGLEGLKTLQSDIFDIVLCDFLMPIMDGLDCIQQYRSWEKIHRPWYRQYIIGISAHATERDSLRGIECGMDSFVSKPVTLDVVKQLVKDEKLLQARKHLDSIFDKNNFSESLNFATDLPVPGSETRLSCLIAEASKNISMTMSKAAESKGWIAVVVEDGNDALSLMKSRNWNSVFISDDLPKLAGSQCIDEFRQWEKDNRVAKQKNVVLVCSYCVAPPSSISTGRSCAVLPSGFDGALSTPIDLKEFSHWLDMASNNCENDILLR